MAVQRVVVSSNRAFICGKSWSAITRARIRNGNTVRCGRCRLLGCIDISAQGLKIRDVDLFDVGEVRDSPLRILQALGDVPSQSNNLDLFTSVLADRPGAA